MLRWLRDGIKEFHQFARKFPLLLYMGLDRVQIRATRVRPNRLTAFHFPQQMTNLARGGLCIILESKGHPLFCLLWDDSRRNT